MYVYASLESFIKYDIDQINGAVVVQAVCCKQSVSSEIHSRYPHTLLRSDSLHHDSSIYFVYVILYKTYKTCVFIHFIPFSFFSFLKNPINPLNPELNPICYLLALLAHSFLHVSRIRVKSLTLRLLMSYIHGAPILDVSKSYITTHHSR